MDDPSGQARRAIEQALGYPLFVEGEGGRLVISGPAERIEDRDAALAIAREIAPEFIIEDDITVQAVMPGDLAGMHISSTDQGMFTGAAPGIESDDGLEAGDFTDATTLDNPDSATGPTSSLDDDVSDGGEVYIPPIDPVGTDTEIIGGTQSSSMQDLEPERSALDGRYGDEALHDAILRELREDAATTDLRLSVHVFRGVARLRGIVADLADAENAEEVASRVPGVVEVIDETEVEGF